MGHLSDVSDVAIGRLDVDLGLATGGGAGGFRLVCLAIVFKSRSIDRFLVVKF